MSPESKTKKADPKANPRRRPNRKTSRSKPEEEKVTGRISTFTGQRLSKRDEFVLRMGREERKRESLEPDFAVVDEYLADEDIKKMTERYTPEFFYRFAMAFFNYEAGEWSVAKKKLEDLQHCLPEPVEEEDLLLRIAKKPPGTDPKNPTEQAKPSADTNAKLAKSQKNPGKGTPAAPQEVVRLLDGPSKCLLEYMKTYDFVAPPEWPGYRPLTGV